MNRVEEIKHNKNRQTQRFPCALVHRSPGYAVLKYCSREPGRVGDVFIDKGSCTVAHYWEDRGYVVWRMFSPAGKLIGTLFHICSDVTISDKTVAYTDLLIDVWIGPDGFIQVLDEDELQECIEAGTVSRREKECIEAHKKAILINYRQIIDEIESMDYAATEGRHRKA